MKKVLILVNHDIVIYNFRRELVEKLLQEGFEVYVSSPYGERIDKLVDMGCKYVEANINRHGTNILEELKLLRYYKKIMKEIKPNVVLTYTIKPNIYGGIAAKKLGIPYIANITGLGTAVENKTIMQKVTVALYKYSFKQIHRVFFQNEENMKFFINNKIALKKHRLIPGSGVNLEQFYLMDYPSGATIEFVFISRIMKEKGIELYIEAAKIIKEKYKNVNFHVCGFCEESYEFILNELHEKKIIIYHGMLRDIKDILKISHCTIHPSYYPEGLSNVLLESAASGRPIISTDRSGCREVIEDGINGYITKPNNTFDLIENIKKFLGLTHEDKERMGIKGRIKMENEFDRNKVVEAYIGEINDILNIHEPYIKGDDNGRAWKREIQ